MTEVERGSTSAWRRFTLDFFLGGQPLGSREAVSCLLERKRDSLTGLKEHLFESSRTFTRRVLCKFIPAMPTWRSFSKRECRARAKRGQLEMCSVLRPESQGQNLALTVLYVPYSLDRGSSSRQEPLMAIGCQVGREQFKRFNTFLSERWLKTRP